MPSPLTTLTCDALLFDLDGVLVDSTACVEDTWRRWAIRHGLGADAIVSMAHGRRALDTARLGVSPAACLVVEDAPAGLAAAHAAGMRALAVATTHPPAALGDADLTAPSLAAVTVRAERSDSGDVLHVAVCGPHAPSAAGAESDARAR